MLRRKSKQAEVLAKTQLSPSSKSIPKRLLLGNQKNNRMMMRRVSKQAQVLAKTKLTPSSKIFPLGLLFGNQEKNQQNYVVPLLKNISKKTFVRKPKKGQNDDEKAEQVGRGVSQDVVVSLLKKNSKKAFVRKPKQMIE